MTAAGSRAEKLSAVASLATSLADRILDAQIAGRTAPSEQIGALTRAAALLQDHGVPWPPLVEQVLLELADRVDATQLASRPADAGEDVISGLSRFLGALRRERGLAQGV